MKCDVTNAPRIKEITVPSTEMANQRTVGREMPGCYLSKASPGSHSGEGMPANVTPSKHVC